MGPCYTCKTTVAFGGVKRHGYRFCNNACLAQKSAFIDTLSSVSDADVDAEAQNVRNGRCAKCGKSGGVDVHRSTFVWSAIIITRSSESAFIGCTSCALKSQLSATAGTALLGWWGIPFGLVMTPLALGMNVWQMISSSARKAPSAQLRERTRERLAIAAKFAPADPLPTFSPPVVNFAADSEARWRPGGPG